MSSRQVQLGSNRPADTRGQAGDSTHGIGQIFERMSVEEFEAFRDGEVSAEELLVRHGLKDTTTETSIEDFGGSQ